MRENKVTKHANKTGARRVDDDAPRSWSSDKISELVLHSSGLRIANKQYLDYTIVLLGFAYEHLRNRWTTPKQKLCILRAVLHSLEDQTQVLANVLGEYDSWMSTLHAKEDEGEEQSDDV